MSTSKGYLEIFESLCEAYPNTFNYILSSKEHGCWIGASPELLCQVKEDSIKTVSLAGTKLANEEWTDKEKEEQAYVTNYISQTLKRLALSNLKIGETKTLSTGAVQHLKTEIEADLTEQNKWKEVVAALHPTPAVCGIPTKEAKAFILENEKHQRSFYTGFIGISGETKLDCFVNLRCMQMQENKAFLYLGGGLLKASELEKEWEETERKAKTLTKFL